MSRPPVIALAVLLLAWACSSIDLPLDQQTGAQLYTSQGCHRCHSSDGSGGYFGTGPSLQTKRAFWDEAELVRYLADPAAYAATDERLGSRSMAAFGHLDEAARGRLARHVLSLMKPIAEG